MRIGYLAAALAGLLCMGCGQARPPAQQESPAPVAPTDPAPLQRVGAVGSHAPAGADTPLLVLDSGGHSGPITKVLITPDRREVITVSEDKTIRVWDAATGETVRVLRLPIGPGEEGRLSDAALSPDGRVLAVARRGAKEGESGIYLLAMASGRVGRVFPVRGESIRALAFSPDGKWLASGGGDRIVRLWDVAAGRCVHELPERTSQVTGLAFSPDSRHLVMGFRRRVDLWHVATRRSETVLKGQAGSINAVAWSPDGKTIALGGGVKKAKDDALDKLQPDDEEPTARNLGGFIGLYDPDGRLRKRLECPRTFVHSLTFTEDSRALLLVGKQQYCALLDLDGKERVKFTRHLARTGTLAPGNRLAITAGSKGEEVFLGRTADAAVVHRLGGKGHGVYSVGWNPDGTTVAWSNKATGLMDIEEKLRIPLEHTFSLVELEAGRPPDATCRRARTSLGALSLKKLNAGWVAVKQGKETIATLKFPPVQGTGIAVNCFTLLPGERAVLGGARGKLALFDTRSGKIVRNFEATTALAAIAPSPDNRYLLTSGTDQPLRV